MGKICLHVSADNTVRAVYNDHLTPYIATVGGSLIRTHILPDNSHTRGGNFKVDLREVRGNVHYVDEAGLPFVTYRAAVAFELRYLGRTFGVKKGIGYVGA